MKQDCQCCTGIAISTPASTENRPGLSAISYRIGTYTSFFDTMRARLSSSEFPELAALKTRAAEDPAIALLDAWAVTADVLSFYQERLANEAYLATATERRSVIELARLIGYQPRPGVSASVYLAYEMDANATELEIPPQTRAQSVPGPGEQMQTFETAEPLKARAEWNTLELRMSQPPRRDPETILRQSLYFQGTATLLKANDVLLVDFGTGGKLMPCRVGSLEVNVAASRTRVDLMPFPTPSGVRAKETDAPKIEPSKIESGFTTLISQLVSPPSLPPRNELRLTRDIRAAFATGSDVFPQLLQASLPGLADSLYGALAHTKATAPVPIKVYALRAKAALFANNAPNPFIKSVPVGGAANVSTTPLSLATAWIGLVPPQTDDEAAKKGLTLIGLDAPYEQIKPEGSASLASSVTASYVLIDRPDIKFGDTSGQGEHVVRDEFLTGNRLSTIHRITQANTVAMSAGISLTGKVTQLGLDRGWLSKTDTDKIENLLKSTLLLRGTQVYAQSELLVLADDPVEDDICDHFQGLPSLAREIELDGLYDGLKPGRWLVLTGQRTDVPGTTATPGAERVMLAGVRHGIKHVDKDPIPLDGDTIHTFITLAKPLAYCYKRDTVALYGNVVRADHGETRRETLGGGDGRQAFQSFGLKQPPLTFVAANSPEGISSTLEMRVNGVRWREADTLLNIGPGAPRYITRRDDDEKTSVIFGDGKQGARLPTGQENIFAIYRNGIGRVGNVRALQISLTTDKPLGVKGVSNPLRASGGADRDSRDQARRNAPLAVMALDRLVSVQDYADFARTFAGIGKAVATRLTDGRRQLIHLTIAGADDVPIDLDSDLYLNLIDALRRNGDPHLPVQVQARKLRPLLIHAKVAVAPDYPWELVAPKIRATLLDAFGFERRELGQDVLQSTVIAVIQSVPGVLYSVVEISALTEEQIMNRLEPQGPISTNNGSRAEAAGAIPVFGLGAQTTDPLDHPNIAVAPASMEGPAELVYLLPAVPETLLLELQA